MTKRDWMWVGVVTMILVAWFGFAAKVIGLWPCATETSVNCTWYADVQGNGEGDTVRN